MQPFSSQEEAITYVTSELRRALPTGWRAHPLDPLAWEIRHEGDNSDGYLLMMPASLDFFILTYGNDNGGIWGLHHEQQRAMVASLTGMAKYGLADCIKYVIKDCRQNENYST